jgi:hypothetical protein
MGNGSVFESTPHEENIILLVFRIKNQFFGLHFRGLICPAQL